MTTAPAETVYVVASPARLRLLELAGVSAALPDGPIDPTRAEVVIIDTHQSDPRQRAEITRLAQLLDTDPDELLARTDDGAPSQVAAIQRGLEARGVRMRSVLTVPPGFWLCGGDELRRTLDFAALAREELVLNPGGPITIAAPNGLFLTLETIMSKPLPPVEWLVKELIPAGDRVVFYGEFGAMKSWILLHLALHLAAGKPWLDRFEIPHPRRVLYIDEEMNTRTLQRRVKRLADGADLSRDAPFVALSRPGLRFDSGGVDKVLRTLSEKRFDPEVIIVEALRRVLVGNENEASDVAAFWQFIAPLAGSGRTFILSHHMRKPSRDGGNSPRDRASGSTDIQAGPDTTFAVERLGAGVSRISRQKGREGEDPAPFVVMLNAPGADGSAVMRCADPGTLSGRLGEAMRDIEAHMTSEPGREASRRELITKSRQSESTVERAIRQLEQAGKLARGRRGVFCWAEATAAAGPSLQGV